MRALFWEFPNEPELFAIDRQFLVGRDILVTPVLTPNVSSVDGAFCMTHFKNVSLMFYFLQASSPAAERPSGAIGTPTTSSKRSPAATRRSQRRSATSTYTSAMAQRYFYTRPRRTRSRRRVKAHSRCSSRCLRMAKHSARRTSMTAWLTRRARARLSALRQAKAA